MRYFIILLLVFGCAAPAIKDTPQTIQLQITSDAPVKISEKCEDQISRSMEIKNPGGQLSSLTFVENGEAYFKLFSYIGALDSSSLWQDIIVLQSMGVDTLHVMINSGGGSAFDGLALADSILYARSLGFKVYGTAVGLVASAAVPPFASCEFRDATPSAQFMVHKAKLGKLYAYEDVDELKSQQKMLNLLREKYINLLVAGSKLSAKDWEDRIKCTTYFNAAEALEWGLVQNIK